MEALSIFSILIGLFIFSIQFLALLTGSANSLENLLIGIGFVLAGLYVPVSNYRKEKKRKAIIMSHKDEWGEAFCRRILAKKVSIDMNPKMVILAWGKPDKRDQKEISKSGLRKIRWVYGQPRKGASYVSFTNGRVARIKTS